MSCGGEGSSSDEQALRILEDLHTACGEVRWLWSGERPPASAEPLARAVVGFEWTMGFSDHVDQQLSRAQERATAPLSQLFYLMRWAHNHWGSTLEALRGGPRTGEDVAQAVARALGCAAAGAGQALELRSRQVLGAYRQVREKLGAHPPHPQGQALPLAPVDVEACRESGTRWSAIVAIGDELLRLRVALDKATRDARECRQLGQPVAEGLEQFRGMVAERTQKTLEECRFNARVLHGIGDPEASDEERGRLYQELWDHNGQSACLLIV